MLAEHQGYQIVALADYFPDVVNKSGDRLKVPPSRRFSGLIASPGMPYPRWTQDAMSSNGLILNHRGEHIHNIHDFVCTCTAYGLDGYLEVVNTKTPFPEKS